MKQHCIAKHQENEDFESTVHIDEHRHEVKEDENLFCVSKTDEEDPEANMLGCDSCTPWMSSTKVESSYFEK